MQEQFLSPGLENKLRVYESVKRSATPKKMMKAV